MRIPCYSLIQKISFCSDKRHVGLDGLGQVPVQIRHVDFVEKSEGTGRGTNDKRRRVWGLMQRTKMAAAYEGKTVKQFLMDLARGRLAEMEKKGILPKGK